MKKNEIEIGGKYEAKVSDKTAVVQITSEHHNGGWNAINVATRRVVRIRTAGRLRRPAGGKFIIAGGGRYLTNEPRWVADRKLAKVFATREEGREYFQKMSGLSLEVVADTRLQEVAK